MIPAHALALRPGIVRWNLVVRWNHDNVLSAGSVVLPLFLGAILLGGCAGPVPQESREDILKDIRSTTLIPNLGAYDDEVQKHALDRILVSLRKAPVITRNLLVAELQDPFIGARTKRVICTILAREGDQRALPTLSSMLAEGNVLDDDLIETALLEFGEVSLPLVMTVLQEGPVTARRMAASILLSLGVSQAFDALEDRYPNERDTEVRFLCVCGFADDKRSGSNRSLTDALDDIEEGIRQAAWGALQRRGLLPRSLGFDPEGMPSIRQSQIENIRSWFAGDSTPVENRNQEAQSL
ncbi:MAG: hypothetical protein GWP41_02410 [Planctomycetia bacterium]|nr:hypothetical protein [Planctomycetia bacterium]